MKDEDMHGIYTTRSGGSKPWNGFRLSWLTPEDQDELVKLVESYPPGVEAGAIAYWMRTAMAFAWDAAEAQGDDGFTSAWRRAVELTKVHRLNTVTLQAMHDLVKEYKKGREQ